MRYGIFLLVVVGEKGIKRFCSVALLDAPLVDASIYSTAQLFIVSFVCFPCWHYVATLQTHVAAVSSTLEAAGAAIMQRKSLADIGSNLAQCGETMKFIAVSIEALAPTYEEAKIASQRMAYAADRMLLAGTELQGTSEKPKKGKSWLKG